MNRVIASITILHVFAHSVLGCCWHAEHSAQMQSEVVVKYGCTSHGSHAHSATSKAADKSTASQVACNSRGDSPHDCCHSTCQWLDIRESKGLVELDSKSIQNWVDIASPSRSNFSTSLGISFGRSTSSQSLAPPVRAHLAKCVLQI